MNIVVFDIGGTSFRSALFTESGELINVKKQNSPSYIKYPNLSIEELQKILIEQIDLNIKRLSKKYKISGISIAFPGIVIEDGSVYDAATLWGMEKKKLNLSTILSSKYNIPTYILNDVSAAGYKEVSNYRYFCIITISSGIGNKCFKDGKILLDNGYGGEMGHIKVPFFMDDTGCSQLMDIGEISSGRGAVNVANLLKSKKSSYMKSIVYEKKITAELISEGFLLDDEFCSEVIKIGVENLAVIINIIINCLGITNYLLIGGFGLSMGEKYSKLLLESILRREPYGFNLEKKETLIVMLEKTDNHCIYGAGIYGLNKMKGVTYYGTQ